MSSYPPEDRYDQGFDTGYRVGPHGIEPDGRPAAEFYDTDMVGDPGYRRGVSEGRAKRIDDGGTRQGWPWVASINDETL